MFREMRRKRQELEERDCIEILKKGQTGVLAVAGSDGYPYAVPLNYVYDEREKENLFPQRQFRTQAGRHPRKRKGFLLCDREGSAGAGGVYHLLFQCDRLRPGADSLG